MIFYSLDCRKHPVKFQCSENSIFFSQKSVSEYEQGAPLFWNALPFEPWASIEESHATNSHTILTYIVLFLLILEISVYFPGDVLRLNNMLLCKPKWLPPILLFFTKYYYELIVRQNRGLSYLKIDDISEHQMGCYVMGCCD